MKINQISEPIEFTHFDTWGYDDNYDEDDQEIVDPFDSEVSEYLSIAEGVLKSWSESLDLPIIENLLEKTGTSTLEECFTKTGFSESMDIVVDQIVNTGLHVYFSENMIEIYDEIEE